MIDLSQRFQAYVEFGAPSKHQLKSVVRPECNFDAYDFPVTAEGNKIGTFSVHVRDELEIARIYHSFRQLPAVGEENKPGFRPAVEANAVLVYSGRGRQDRHPVFFP